MNKNSYTRSQAATTLRSLCAETIRNNPDDWPDWKIGRSVESYTNNLLDPDSWGGEIEVTYNASLHSNNERFVVRVGAKV